MLYVYLNFTFAAVSAQGGLSWEGLTTVSVQVFVGSLQIVLCASVSPAPQEEK